MKVTKSSNSNQFYIMSSTERLKLLFWEVLLLQETKHRKNEVEPVFSVGLGRDLPHLKLGGGLCSTSHRQMFLKFCKTRNQFMEHLRRIHRCPLFLFTFAWACAVTNAHGQNNYVGRQITRIRRLIRRMMPSRARPVEDAAL